MANPLFVQDDGKIFVSDDGPDFDGLRSELSTFGFLTEQQQPMYVYQMTPTSLWQAASLGLTPRDVLSFLRKHVTSPIALPVQEMIVKEMGKWGVFRLTQTTPSSIQLSFPKDSLETLLKLPVVQQRHLGVFANRILFPADIRGTLKQALAHSGIPVVDAVDYEPSVVLSAQLRRDTILRDYQEAAVRAFFRKEFHQSGIVILPCGSGKTLIGVAILCEIGLHTLIVTPSEVAAQQWIGECRKRTTLASESIGMYKATQPLTPVTVTTYQRVSGRSQGGVYRHLQRLTGHPWGLVIYDEVHMLPAPLFRLAADLQTARRLGLTATLVREDGAETDVYSLIGPKCYEADWKVLERKGYLAKVNCVELQIPLSASEQANYDRALPRERHRMAALNSNKIDWVKVLLHRHHDDKILIIGHYLESLRTVARLFHLPLITGQTSQQQRSEIYQAFREGSLHCLVLSRVANMAIDLPQATVGIQISGLYASRQEEAQRLGRLLRPKEQSAFFYTLVSAGTVEAQVARKRQRFLVERGYHYTVQNVSRERVTRQ